jgi:DNA (cytosine-5)-methyltransferase 1
MGERIDQYCQKVLEKNFPTVTRYGDIREFDGTKYRGAIDVLSGGFPCQPFSSAGKRKGTEDNRYLWPEMLRVIREVQPHYVVGENVGGLVNWSGGMVFDKVQANLENEGFEVQAFILPACAVQAPHRRDRIWFIAHSNSNGRRIANSGRNAGESQGRMEQPFKPGGLHAPDNKGTGLQSGITECRTEKAESITCNSCEILTDSNSELSGYRYNGKGNAFGSTETTYEEPGYSIPNTKQWDVEPALDRVADGIPNRVDRIKGLGNAIVPQVAFEIFKAIESISKAA